MSSNTQVKHRNDFGHSWAIDKVECEPPVDPQPCLEESERYRQAADLCYILIDETGGSDGRAVWYHTLTCSGSANVSDAICHIQTLFPKSVALIGVLLDFCYV